MSELSGSATAEGMRQQADNALQLARTIMAASLALEDGEMTKEEAVQFIQDCNDESVVFSDHYPGDEYFDRGDHELGVLP